MKNKRITSVMQLVNSYHVAETIYNMKEGKEMISDSDYVFHEKWKLESKDKRMLDLYSRIIKTVRKNVKIVAIVKVGFEEIEKLKFQDSPSVSSNQNDNKNIRNVVTSREMELLKKIDLKKHTLDVVEEILKKTEKNEIYGVGIIITGCLFHDFGKSKEVRMIVTPDAVSENSSKYLPHAQVSALFVKDAIKERVKQELLEKNENSAIEETIKDIANLVENHHNSSNKWKQKVELINNADSMARKRELKELMEN